MTHQLDSIQLFSVFIVGIALGVLLVGSLFMSLIDEMGERFCTSHNLTYTKYETSNNWVMSIKCKENPQPIVNQEPTKIDGIGILVSDK